MILAIRHYPDRKRPCIVLEEDNRGLIIGYITDRKREEWLKKALMIDGDITIELQTISLYDLITKISESEV